MTTIIGILFILSTIYCVYKMIQFNKPGTTISDGAGTGYEAGAFISAVLAAYFLIVL